MAIESRNGSVAPPELDSVAVTIYLQVLQDGELSRTAASEAAGVTLVEVDRACSTLVKSHLLTTVAGDPKRFVPVNPEIAAARLVEPMDNIIRSYRSMADATRERLLDLMPAYLARREAVNLHQNQAFETIVDAADVRLLIAESVKHSTKDMMTVQPGGARDPGGLDEALPRDLDALRRGVRVRVLYQHTARASLHTRTYVTSIEELGGQVRTMEQIAERMLIFDRSTVFIPKWINPDESPGALIVREPVLVAFLCSFFEQMWLTATPYVPEAPGYQEVSDDLRRSILRLLAQGFKDEVVARRLGMSVRTCRRHIAAIMKDLGAESRFEAGAKAAQLGLMNKDDPF
jgi:sugar-specific transcriptional regulator TrmB/DNA-binding CsgD family transcriptional regulator